MILFVEGFKRPERFLALADRALEIGKPIMAVKVGRSRQAQAAAVAHSGSLAGEARATDAALAAAGVIRLRGPRRSCSRRPSSSPAAAGSGRRVGRGRTGVVTVSTGEASLIADLAPRTGIDLPDVPAGGPRAALLARPADARLHRQPARPVGRHRPGRPPTRPPSTPSPASGAYDVLALVHDFPYRSLPSEVETALEVVGAAARARPPTGRSSCRSSCR